MNSDLATWLARHQLNVAELFEDNGVTLISDVQNLSVDDMAEIGLGSVEVGKLQAALATSPPGAAGSALPPVLEPEASSQSIGSAGSEADSGDARTRRSSLVWRRSEVGDWEEGVGTEAEVAEAMATAMAEQAVTARRPPSSSSSSSSETEDDHHHEHDDSEAQEVAVKAVEAVEAVEAAGAGEWLEYFDDDGSPYYCNASTGETVWGKPEEEACLQEASTDSDLGSRDSDSVLGVDLSTDSLPSVPSVTASTSLSSQAVHTPGGAGAAAQGVLESVASAAPAAPAAPAAETGLVTLSVRHSVGTPPPPPSPAAPPPPTGPSGNAAPPPRETAAAAGPSYTPLSYTAVVQRTAGGLGLNVDDDNCLLEIDSRGAAASCTELTCGDRVVALNGEPNPNPNPNRRLNGEAPVHLSPNPNPDH